jgi:hypothetical protein
MSDNKSDDELEETRRTLSKYRVYDGESESKSASKGVSKNVSKSLSKSLSKSRKSLDREPISAMEHLKRSVSQKQNAASNPYITYMKKVENTIHAKAGGSGEGATLYSRWYHWARDKYLKGEKPTKDNVDVLYPEGSMPRTREEFFKGPPEVTAEMIQERKLKGELPFQVTRMNRSKEAKRPPPKFEDTRKEFEFQRILVDIQRLQFDRDQLWLSNQHRPDVQVLSDVIDFLIINPPNLR